MSGSSKSNKAKLFAERKHTNQFDKAGDPCVFHLSFVAETLAGEQDDVIIATAWLHDSAEDTKTTFAEIKNLFGEPIAVESPRTE